MLDHVVTLLHRQLDDRSAGQVADDEQPRDGALEVLRQLRAPAGTSRGSEQIALEPALQRLDLDDDFRPARSTSESAVGSMSAPQSPQREEVGWF